MWFGYNPCIYFCYFFHLANFVIFWPQILWKCCDSGYLVSATPHTVLYWSFWNFVHIFAIVWRCAYGLGIILELIFVTFSTLWALSFLTSDSMKVYRQWLPCKHNSLYSFMRVFMQLCTSFFPWFEVNFCHFSTLLTLSVFAGATSTSQSSIYFLDPLGSLTPGGQETPGYLDPCPGYLDPPPPPPRPPRRNIPYLVSCPQIP